jgi:hypothetical protein
VVVQIGIQMSATILKSRGGVRRATGCAG